MTSYRNVTQGVTYGKDASPLNASFPPTGEGEEHFLCVQGHCGFGVGGHLAPMVSLDSVTLELCFFSSSFGRKKVATSF